ncbi:MULTISPECIES: phosphoglycerate dehydrogenase [Polyangium]|uniref:D-3-phosphoglycerate dehydrogenase n=2 Tax=Polyangium TaxID=55 RepID=A0A4V5PPH9_9BACT|nr:MULTISPECIES: phosphoglycerate dehydrogenase [Polyangium]MDI1432539.1 phosphoglycerate dehydrogenase [Polyangium sorediatum]TKD04992.1 phosphoglycerate dehydrogenase [Polyangium fumosum]
MTTPAPAELPRDTIQVLLLENIHPSATETFHAFSEGRTYAITKKSSALKEDELIAALPGVQLLGIRSKTRITARVVENAHDLLSIGCFCIGTNQVDLVAANARGVPVFNAPFSNTRSVAELMIGEIILLARQLGDRSREVHTGVWKKVAANCYEVRGKVLGIIGYGHIGRQLGVLAEAVGMRVLYHDIAARLPMGNNRSVPSLAALLAEADFVSLHVPETPETRNMIGAAELAKMRKGSYLLNASRGTVVDIPALVAALKSGHLAGAAIDVYPEEPESNTDQFKTELQNLSNVLLTPHIGGSTEEAQEAIGREVAAVLGKFATMGATTGSVNFPQVELPPVKGTHRILNVHRNVPGVLRDVNRVVADLNANIDSQFLATEGAIGYLIMDLEQDVSAEVSRRLEALPSNIRTRVVY